MESLLEQTFQDSVFLLFANIQIFSRFGSRRLVLRHHDTYSASSIDVYVEHEYRFQRKSLHMRLPVLSARKSAKLSINCCNKMVKSCGVCLVSCIQGAGYSIVKATLQICCEFRDRVKSSSGGVKWAVSVLVSRHGWNEWKESAGLVFDMCHNSSSDSLSKLASRPLLPLVLPPCV